MKNQFDFCYVYDDGLEKRLEDYLFGERIRPEKCGLRAMQKFTDCFEIFFDLSSVNGNPPRGLVGIPTNGELTVSTIPSGMVPVAIVHFNRNEYENS